MHEPDGRIRRLFPRSIFLKLLLVYVATTLALILAIGGFFRLMWQNEARFKQTRARLKANHLEHLIDQIGSPPDRERATRLSRELGLQIRVEGATGTWATDPALPTSADLSVSHTLANLHMQLGRYHGRRFTIMDRGSTRYLFFYPEPPELEPGNVAVVVGMLVLILGGSYLAIRWFFLPLDWLTQGVSEIAKGNLTHEVPIRSHDELGRLTQALNNMTARVRDMLRARDQLLLDISHELRSPLTRMKVELEFVREESVKTEIKREIRDLDTMLTELLESERLDSASGGLELVEADLVPMVLDLAERYSREGPGVRVVSAPLQAPLKLDKLRVRTALRNVLDNARKHSTPGKGPVEIRMEKDASTVRLSVRDHGPGIALDEQTLVFEPFYRVDKSRTRSTGGYGLGLSLVKKIMIAHGGDILLSSELGKGSTFTLSFPIT